MGSVPGKQDRNSSAPTSSLLADTEMEIREGFGFAICRCPCQLPSQDAQPPLTPRQGLDYRGRVPDASPQYRPKFL